MTVANLAVLEADICYLTEQRYAGHDQANALQCPKTKTHKTLANGDMGTALNGQK